MKWLLSYCYCITALALSVKYVSALSLDPVASAELEQYIKKGDCVISMRHIRPRRKLHISIEALFMVDFPTLKHKLSFFLDRKQQRVTLDVSAAGEVESIHFNIPHINETSTIRSLALHFHKNRISVLVDCKETAAHDIEMNLTKLYTQMDDPVVKLFRERKYPLHFDSNIENALQRANCQKGGHNRRGNRRMLKNQITEREKTKKRDVRNWFNNHEQQQQQQQQQYRPQPEITLDMEQRRGDIPMMSGDCEDALAKSMSELMALVKLLREEVAQQRQEVAYLRMLLENCPGCKEHNKIGDNNIHIEPTCRSSNPCYPGVECFDSVGGPRCGRCPLGLVGDGKTCKPGVTCADRPCYIGVQCHDTISGARCDACPLGYEGDGRTCEKRNPCLISPCPTGIGSLLAPTTHNVQHYQRQYTARKYSVMSS